MSQTDLNNPEDFILAIHARDAAGTAYPVAVLKADMTFEFMEGYTPDGAAKIFWDSLTFEGKTLRDRNTELSEALEYWVTQAQQHHEAYMLADAERVALAEELIQAKNFRMTD